MRDRFFGVLDDGSTSVLVPETVAPAFTRHTQRVKLPNLAIFRDNNSMLNVARYFFRYPGKTLRLFIQGIAPQSALNTPQNRVPIRDRFRHLIRVADESCGHWRSRRSSGGAAPIARDAKVDDLGWPQFKPVPKLLSAPSLQPASTLICFYLPQFHPIPENDRWWGAGFTEWTNVLPARPQFEGHYQPHVPTELGYYDLREPGIQRRQVELAKLYGIGGFCFYFYWFGGTRLLETPVRSYLKDASLDLPFCLCWANENWTRRWDGLESDVLMQQQHSSEDDLAFISYVSEYLRDHRYIRIGGKPLLIVYRPSLLPSPKNTAQRWRAWCRAHGIGEIHLAYTQSFERIDPALYGFDSAIEFPPNNSSPPSINPSLANEDFAGAVYDWRVFPARSRNYELPKYTLFRGVNPSWDNTARKKNRATIFVNSSPVGYQEWLVNAMIDTRVRLRCDDERLVFINAWNEWAEGAHLEPDERHGFAFLEATRVAHVRAGLTSPEPRPPRSSSLAIIVHAFYKDVFQELASNLRDLLPIFGGTVKVFVSTVEDLASDIRSICTSLGLAAQVVVVPNRGRDVLPFLHVLRTIAVEDFDLVLKLHTKKSPHRKDGDKWRKDLVSKLLDKTTAGCIHGFFSANPGVGVVAPDGYVATISDYWGSNMALVIDLGRRLGIDGSEVQWMRFAAGTMFYCRTTALLPILNISIGDDCFEEEVGQVDGTLAHAIERCFAFGAYSLGMSIASTADVLRDVQRASGQGLSLRNFYRAGRRGIKI